MFPGSTEPGWLTLHALRSLNRDAPRGLSAESGHEYWTYRRLPGGADWSTIFRSAIRRSTTGAAHG